MKRLLLAAMLPSLLVACATPTTGHAPTDVGMTASATAVALDSAVAGSWRDPENAKRDQYRRLFGLPDDAIAPVPQGPLGLS